MILFLIQLVKVIKTQNLLKIRNQIKKIVNKNLVNQERIAKKKNKRDKKKRKRNKIIKVVVQ